MPRPRKPEAIKKLEGTDRPYRQRNEAEYQLIREAVPPISLAGPHAQYLWDMMIRNLKAAKVMAEPDLVLLAHWANMHQRMTDLWERGESPTAADMTQFRMIANEFGATPASRSKPVPVEDRKESANPFAKFA